MATYGNPIVASPNMLPSTADVFSASTAYSKGDYVWHNGKLYCFTADHAAGAWTGSDATAAKLANDVADLKSATDQLVDGHALQPLLFTGTFVTWSGSNNSSGELYNGTPGYEFKDTDRITSGSNSNYAILHRINEANYIPAMSTVGDKMTVALWVALAAGVESVDTRMINIGTDTQWNSSYKWAGNEYFVLKPGWNLMELECKGAGTGGTGSKYRNFYIRCSTLGKIQNIKSVQVYVDGKATPANYMPASTPVSVEPLAGKKWAVCGDSFTAGADSGTLDSGNYAGQKIVYPYIIGNRTGINVLKFFENGRTLAMPATPGDFVNSLCASDQDWYYQNIPADVDYITIQLGINDNHHAPDNSDGDDGEDTTGEIPIGTISDNTTATYYGAWNVVLTWLITNRPFAHIGMIVTNGATADYRTAQLDIAKKYGIPYIDLNGDSRTPCMIRSCNTDIASAVRTAINEKQRISASNTHPNNDAHRYEATFIENFLRTL